MFWSRATKNRGAVPGWNPTFTLMSWLRAGNAAARPRLRMSAAAASFDLMACLLRGFGIASLAVPMHDLLLDQRDRALQQKSDDPDRDQTDVDVVYAEESRRVHDHVAEADLRGHQLRGDDQRPADRRADADSREDLRQRGGKDHVEEELAPLRAEAAAGAQQLLGHAFHRGHGVDQDVEKGRKEDHRDLGELADAEPEDHQRHEGDRGYRAQEREPRGQQRLERLRAPDQQDE